jgi:S1-C subfamily serine protease
MTGSVVLDLLLIVLLIAYAVFGFRRGFILSLGSFVGIVVGALAAFFAIPLVTGWVTASQFRLPVILVVVVALVALGQAAGSALGRVIRRRVDKTPLRAVDRVFGAAITLVGAALVVSMLAFGLGSLGVPVVSQAIGSSTVVSTIDRVTPDPVKALEAKVRSLFALDGLPRLFEALGTETPLPVPTAGQTTAQQASARSVVKITGNAYQCGQNQSGSGFVSSSGRVVTNAHVVAGVTQPVVLTPSGATYTGRVVYFDAVQDLAVIAIAGLPTAPLPLGADLATGATAVFDGYPLGGPFLSSPAAVRRNNRLPRHLRRQSESARGLLSCRRRAGGKLRWTVDRRCGKRHGGDLRAVGDHEPSRVRHDDEETGPGGRPGTGLDRRRVIRNLHARLAARAASCTAGCVKR